MDSYTPQVDDYVRWGHLQGWIYWIDSKNSYLTIEISTKEKSEQSYKDCMLHRNYRCLVCCFPERWHELEYVKNRREVLSEMLVDDSLYPYKSQEGRYLDIQ